MATDGRIGASIAWLTPRDAAMLDTADRIQSMRGYLDNPIRVSLTPQSARRASQIFRRLAAAEPSEILFLALRRYNFAVERDYLLDQLIDCWVALEGLFAPDFSAGVRYRVCLRAARFLGQSAADRASLFQFLKKSYDARSKIVHGGAPPRDLRSICEETQRRLRDAILAWIDPRRDHNILGIDAELLA